MSSRRIALLFAFFPFAFACSSDEEFKPAKPFENREHIKIWANSSSALAAYLHAYQPIGVADGEVSFQDPACPETSDTGTELTIRGGCTDSSGEEWTGRATVTRDGDNRLVTFDGYEEKNGTVRVTSLGASLHEFDVELVVGDVTTIDYVGTVEGGYTGRTVWNGEGRIERDGVIAPTGSVEARTVEQVVDGDVCSGESTSGTTTLRSGEHTAVIVYDGASDCDPDASAQVTVNDESIGLVGGISCSVAHAGARRTAEGAVWLLAAAALVARFRRRLRG